VLSLFKRFRNTLYIRLEPERIRILHVESGHEITDTPTLAVETRKSQQIVVAAGRDAIALSTQPNVCVRNGFLHPRTLLADFAIAEQTLRYFIKQAQPKSVLVIAPIIVIHPLALLEGGLTQIEIRAFTELGAMSGARQVYIWTGPDLSREELSNLCFSRTGGQLLS